MRYVIRKRIVMTYVQHARVYVWMRPWTKPGLSAMPFSETRNIQNARGMTHSLAARLTARMAAFGLSSEKAYRPVRVLLPTWMIEHARCNVARTRSPVGRWTGVYQRAILRPRRYILQCYTLSSMFFSTWAFLIPYGEEKTSPPPSFDLILYPIGRTNERINERGLLLCIMELFHFVSSFAFMLQGSYITISIYF